MPHEQWEVKSASFVQMWILHASHDFFILLQGFRNSVPFSRDEKPFSLDSMILPICDTRFFGLKLSLGFIEQNTNLPTHKRRWTDVNNIFLHLVWVFCFICHSQTNPRADNYGSTDPFSTNSCRTFLVLCNFCSWINKQSRKCSADVKTVILFFRQHLFLCPFCEALLAGFCRSCCHNKVKARTRNTHLFFKTVQLYMYMYTARKLPGKHVDLLYPQSLKLFM